MAGTRLTPRATLILLLAAGLIALSVAPARQLYKQWQETNQLERELAELRADNDKMREEIERLKTDAYIEQQARARLGLVKPGEQAYVIVPPKQSAKEEKAKREAELKAEKKVEKPKSWWARVVDFLKGLF